MDIKEMTMVTILALLPTVMQGRKLERDAFPRATCTAPMATKGETAVVTCHYPLEVKQPGEIVAVSVERYPFTSSNTGSPRRDYVLECMWHHNNFTCTLDEEEHRVEGKDIVITIRNVAEDNQGRYLCKMMVKDGANIHGDPCLLRLNDTGSGGGLVAGSVAAVVGVLVAVVTAVVFVCRKRKQRLYNPVLKSDDEGGIEGGKKQHLEEKDRFVEGKEDQHPHSDQEKPGAQSQVNGDDVNNENGQVAEPDRFVEGKEDHHPLTDQERSGAQSQVNNDDVNYGEGPRQTEPGQQVERAERQTLSGQERCGPRGQVKENKLEEGSENSPGIVQRLKNYYEESSLIVEQFLDPSSFVGEGRGFY